jgi:dihydroceramidase
MVNRNPVYHQIVFGILVLTTTLRISYILRHTSAARLIPDSKKETIVRLFAAGAAMFTFGFVLWNLDNAFCRFLTRTKLKVGWPTAFVLEGPSIDVSPSPQRH